MIIIKKCECSHEEQDKMYGKGRRVFNKLDKSDKGRCTVCGREK